MGKIEILIGRYASLRQKEAELKKEEEETRKMAANIQQQIQEELKKYGLELPYMTFNPNITTVSLGSASTNQSVQIQGIGLPTIFTV